MTRATTADILDAIRAASTGRIDLDQSEAFTRRELQEATGITNEHAMRRVIAQLKAAGVLVSVRVRRRGYALDDRVANLPAYKVVQDGKS